MRKFLCLLIITALLASCGCAFAVDNAIQLPDIIGELSDRFEGFDVSGILQELKSLLKDTENMSDDELREEIRALSDQHKVKLTNGQIDQLLSLCRALEKADAEELKEKIESAQDTLKKLSEAQKKAGNFLQRVKTVMQNVTVFFSDLFGRLRGGK